MAKINVCINGTIKTIKESTIKELLDSYNLNIEEVIIELNGTIIEKNKVYTQQLTTNDSLEIIRYIGGGNN